MRVDWEECDQGGKGGGLTKLAQARWVSMSLKMRKTEGGMRTHRLNFQSCEFRLERAVDRGENSEE